MNILISGANGLVGTYLKTYYQNQGYQVYTLQRHSPQLPFYWNPSKGVIQLDNNISFDLVINLAGVPIAESRWTANRKKEIQQSRVLSTQLLSQALAKQNSKPSLFISASAIGIYGDTFDQITDESSPLGNTFLAETCKKWEEATQEAESQKIRTIHMRLSNVLTLRGGFLEKLRPVFNLGLGGQLGHGQFHMSFVLLHEIGPMIDFIQQNPELQRPINFISFPPTTNQDFTQILAQHLKRKSIFKIPALVLKIIFGQLADELLLSSSRVLPQKLIRAGYQFKTQDLKSALLTLK